MNQNREFDWVRVRANCTAATIFAALKMGAQRDVEARNATIPKGSNFSYQLQSSGNDMFGVVLAAGNTTRMVTFNLTQDSVNVERGDINWSVKPTINDDGECRLKIGNKEYACWQFRKLALEDLLFDNP